MMIRVSAIVLSRALVMSYALTCSIVTGFAG